MNGLWQKISVKYRYLFSFLAAAVLPISVVIFLFYHLNVKELRKDIDTINMDRVLQIQTNIDGEIRSHYNLVSSLETNNDFLLHAGKREQGDIFEALTVLRDIFKYRNVNNAHVLVLKTGTVYNALGCCSYDNYCEKLLMLDPETAANMSGAVFNAKRDDFGKILPIKNMFGQESLIFVYSISGYSPQSEARLLLKISNEVMHEKLSPLIEEFSGSAFILDRSLNKVYEADGEMIVPEEAMQILSNQDFSKAKGTIPISCCGEDFTVLYSRSEFSGLTYGVISYKDNYVTQIIKQKTLIWQIIFLASIICILIVIFLTITNYMPMKKLVKLVCSSGQNGSEYGMIQQAFADKNEYAEHLQESIDQQRPFVIERVLSYILYSEAETDQAAEMMKSTNIRFRYPHLFVMAVALLDANSNMKQSLFKGTIIDLARSDTIEGCELYPVENLQNGYIIVVGSCENSAEYKNYARSFWELAEKIEELNGRITIGVSDICDGLNGLKKALYDTIFLIESSRCSDLLFPEDMGKFNDTAGMLYPAHDLSLLQMQLKQGDKINACKTFIQLYEENQESNQSLIFFKYQSSYIVTAIAEVLQQQPFYADFIPDIRELIHNHSPEEFKSKVLNLITALCSKVSEEQQTSCSNLQSKMLEFIDSHISDINLGLEQVAEEFGYSSYYVSRLFRDQNNQNMKDYIASLRLQESCKLLVETDYSINEIVEKVGYISTSSFIRKFKSVKGITPGEYRRTQKTH